MRKILAIIALILLTAGSALALTALPDPGTPNFSKNSRAVFDEWKAAIELNNGHMTEDSFVENIQLLKAKDRAGYVIVSGFYSDGDGGGNLFKWDSTRIKTAHNGGTVIDPDTTITPGATGWWTTTSTSGTGCWVAVDTDGVINISVFGAKAEAGYDNKPAIQGAVDIKKKTFIPDGVFEVQSSIIVSSGTYLFGNVAKSIIKGKFSVPTESILTSDAYNLQNNITLRNFTIDRTDANSQHGALFGGVDNFTVDGINVIGQANPTIASGAMAFSGFDQYADIQSSNVTVTNCLIDKANNFGIQFGNVNGGKIVNNNFTNGWRELVGIETYGTTAINENIVVSGNTITLTENSNHFGGSAGPAVVIGGASSGGYTKNVVVVNNTIIGTETVPLLSYAGIKIIGAPTLYAENITVANNTITNMNGTGIGVGGVGYKTRNINITGNLIVDCNKGLLSETVGAVTISDATKITVASNTIIGLNHDYMIKERTGADNNRYYNNLGDPGKSGVEFLIVGNATEYSNAESFSGTGAGRIRKETVTLSDSATHVFDSIDINNRGIYFLINSFGPGANAIFYANSTSSPVVVDKGASVVFGDTEPSVAGALNVWPNSSSTISVKNLLGSTRSITLVSFGTE